MSQPPANRQASAGFASLSQLREESIRRQQPTTTCSNTPAAEVKITDEQFDENRDALVVAGVFLHKMMSKHGFAVTTAGLKQVFEFFGQTGVPTLNSNFEPVWPVDSDVTAAPVTNVIPPSPAVETTTPRAPGSSASHQPWKRPLDSPAEKPGSATRPRTEDRSKNAPFNPAAFASMWNKDNFTR